MFFLGVGLALVLEGAVNIVYKRELEKARSEGLGKLQGDDAVAAVLKEKTDEFRQRFANPYIAAERGYVDAVIEPRETRKKLIDALEMLQTKRDKLPPKKHGNIPL